MRPQWWRKLLAESFGTFVLVFAGTGAIIINDQSGGTVSHVGIALTFGLIVLSMIYSLGDVSGCHINPAVTLGFFVARRFKGKLVFPYIVSQFAGATLASLTLHWMFPTNINLGATIPVGNVFQSLVLELILAMILMFVILSVSSESKETGMLAGVVIGSVVALEAMFAGPISGASMNPARSFGPALVSGRLEHLWIYMLAPSVGALVGALACRAIHGPECCGQYLRDDNSQYPTNQKTAPIGVDNQEPISSLQGGNHDT